MASEGEVQYVVECFNTSVSSLLKGSRSVNGLTPVLNNTKLFPSL